MSLLNPLVTVLMPVYNGKVFLSQTIKSVLKQTFIDFEFLIIDDCSTDDSVEIVRNYYDERIRLIVNKKNVGQTNTLNKGLKLANGKFIARIDQDDIMHYTRLKEQVKFLNNNPNIAVVGSNYRRIDNDGNYLGELQWPMGFENNLFYVLTGNNPVGHPGVMYRKNVIEEIGYYREKYKYSEDTDLWFRIYKNGFRCDNIPKTLTYNRIHENRSSLKFKKQQYNNHNLAYYDFYTGLVIKRINYNRIDQYLNVLVWKSEKIKLNNLWYIMVIFWNLFKKLIFIHRCNKRLKSTFYNSIITFFYKLFIPFQLIGFIVRILKINSLSTILIKPLSKRI